MKQIIPVIDPEFADLLPRQEPEVIETLRDSIKREGCRDPLIVWRKGNILLDGHTRLPICQEFDVAYQVVLMDFEDRDEAMAWVVRHQLGRRNLTDEQRSYFRGKTYQLNRHSAGRPEKLRHSVAINLLENVAKEHGVSERSIQRDAKYAEAVDKHKPSERKKILAGSETKKQTIDRVKNLCSKCERLGAVKDCPQCAEKAEKKPVILKTPRGETVKDPYGRIVPDGVGDYFGNEDWQSVIAMLEGQIDALEECHKLVMRTIRTPWVWIPGPTIAEKLNEIRNLIVGKCIHPIRDGLPYALCGHCHGKKCKACRNSGYVPKSETELEPKLYRA